VAVVTTRIRSIEAMQTGTAPAVAGRVLVIDDDPHLSEVLARYLGRDGYEVMVSHDGREGLALALQGTDLVVLDVMLPGIDGMTLLRRLRLVSDVPVIMLTARGREDDRVQGLSHGADDYVPKPFSPRELAARVAAVLRRGRERGQRPPPVLRAGAIELDVAARTAQKGGQPVDLTAREFDLLAHFMAHPGRVLGRDELLAAVWGWTVGDTATVTVHVGRLREKIEPDPSAPHHLQTVRGAGYRWIG
jgi:DNA-binding response OmpR family regulator